MKVRYFTLFVAIVLTLMSFNQLEHKPHFRFALVMPTNFEVDQGLKEELRSFEKLMSEKDIKLIKESDEYSKKEKEDLIKAAEEYSFKEAVYAYSIQAFDYYMHKNDAHVKVDLVTAEEYLEIGIEGLTDKKHKYDYIMHYEDLKLTQLDGKPVLKSEIDVYCTYQGKNIVQKDYFGKNINPGGSFDCGDMGEMGCVLMSFVESTVNEVTVAVFEEDQTHK